MVVNIEKPLTNTRKYDNILRVPKFLLYNAVYFVYGSQESYTA